MWCWLAVTGYLVPLLFSKRPAAARPRRPVTRPYATATIAAAGVSGKLGG